MAGVIVNGVIIGIIAVVIFGLVYYTIAFDSVSMADDKLSPLIKKGDLVHYDSVRIDEIKINDLVVYNTGSSIRISKVTTEAGTATAFDRSRIKVTDAYGTEYEIQSLTVEKVSYVIPNGAYILKEILEPPKGIWVFIIIFISPMIIMKLRERGKK